MAGFTISLLDPYDGTVNGTALIDLVEWKFNKINVTGHLEFWLWHGTTHTDKNLYGGKIKIPLGASEILGANNCMIQGRFLDYADKTYGQMKAALASKILKWEGQILDLSTATPV